MASFYPFDSKLQSFRPFPVLGKTIQKQDYIPLDLSVNNKGLENVDTTSPKALEQFIWSQMQQRSAKVAFGGYLEQRKIYNRSTHFNTDERNIHLGTDLWIEANTPIYAPFDATVHSFKNNDNFGDYGPTIILEHNLGNLHFYTLYGHLSLESITHITKSEKITMGQQIASLGTVTENGDYPPHLHFQIIKDMQGMKGDYPGVCSKPQLDFYKANCPDPNLILNLL